MTTSQPVPQSGDFKCLTPLYFPFTMIVAGPTSSGKTWWVTQLLANFQNVTTFKPSGGRKTNVLWCYGQWQDLYSKPIPNTNTQHFKGLVNNNLKSVTHGPSPDVIVIDDLMNETVNDPMLANMFTRESHHQNVSVIFIIQNLYVQGKRIRDITLNTQYLVLMKTKRDMRQIINLGNSIMYGEAKYFKWAYIRATENMPYSYLFCHLHPKSNDTLKLCTWILPNESIRGSPLFFIPNTWST